MVDIGNPSSSGGANFGPATMTVSSGGTDIDGTADQFTFLHRTLTGDGTLTARVATLQSADPLSQSGLMIREALTAGSRHVAVLATPGGMFVRSRVADGASTESTPTVAGAVPVWLKLDRIANVFIASQSVDGVTWQFVGSGVVPLSQTVFVGLAVASHKKGAVATAGMTNVSVIGNGALPAGWAGSDVGSPAVVGGSTSGGTNFILDSAGTGVFGGGDQLRYVYQRRSGDVDIVARVTRFDTATPAALAGVMVRQNLTATSAHASMLVSPGNGTVMRSRNSHGALTTSMASVGAAPIWVRVSRRGSILITARSVDGTTWSTVGQQNVPLTEPYYVGMVVTSGDAATRARATFDGVTITSPNQPPTVTLTSPSSAMTLLAPASLTLTATASDPDGSIAQVDFFAGPTLVGTQRSSPYTFNWTNVKAGTYVVKVIARDNLGAYTSSIERAVTVTGNAQPTVTLTAPNGASFAARATVGLAATASDLDGTVSRVEFYAGSTLLASDTASPYTHAWVSAPNGTHVLKAVAIDNAGATTTSTTRTITVGGAQASPPTVSLTSPAAGATVPPHSTVTIAATAADADGSVSRVEFYAGTTLIGSQKAAPFAISWVVPAGLHVLKAVAFDNTGLSTTSATRTISTTQNGSPTVALTAPLNGQVFTAPATITLTATASDADGTVSKVEFYVGSTLVGSDTSAPYSFTWTNVVAGNYGITAVARDNTNNMTVSSARDITAVVGGVPNTLVFLPSVEHADIDRYRLEIFAAGETPGVSLPVAAKDLGLPPVVDGECTADVATTISALPAGSYIATVSSENSLGSGRSQWTFFSR